MGLAPVARGYHLLTALVAAFALFAQLVLVIEGSAVLVPESRPPLAERLLRFASYFTIQANFVLLICSISLVRDPERDGNGWRVLRQCALTGIAITAFVHFWLLRPLLHLAGWHWLTDKLLHLATPTLALLGWLIFGPRNRVSWRAVGYALLWPIGWLAYTLTIGTLRGWYPCPFLDVDRNGAGQVAVSCLAIAVLFFAVSAVLLVLDRRLAKAG